MGKGIYRTSEYYGDISVGDAPNTLGSSMSIDDLVKELLHDYKHAESELIDANEEIARLQKILDDNEIDY